MSRRLADAKRANGYARGWTAEWADFRAAFLSMYPLCTSPRCAALPEHLRPAATEVDHIDGSGRDGELAFDPHNCQALCKPCHSRKTVAQDGGFGRPKVRAED